MSATANIWVLPIYRYRPKRPNFIGLSIGVNKTLLYSSRIQTTCARKHNKASQNSYLAATLAGTFPKTSRRDKPTSRQDKS